MNTSTFPRSGVRAATLALAMALGAALAQSACAASPAKAEQPAVVQEDVTVFELVPGTLYLNGGIGKDEQQRMHQDARNWPLRMTVSSRTDNEFIAGVKLKVFDKDGRAVLRLKDAGPMTYVQLPQGEYRISASYKADTLTRLVQVGSKGLDANFHWAF